MNRTQEGQMIWENEITRNAMLRTNALFCYSANRFMQNFYFYQVISKQVLGFREEKKNSIANYCHYSFKKPKVN